MAMKYILSFLGLFCDLIGAALLSIPMVWSAREAAEYLVGMRRSFEVFLYGPNKEQAKSKVHCFSDDMFEVHSRIFAASVLFSIIFLVIALRILYITAVNYQAEVVWVDQPIAKSVIVIAAVGVTALSLLVSIVLLIRLPIYVARGLMWVARGNYERRIGAVGLVFLCIGFILQALVNIFY